MDRLSAARGETTGTPAMAILRFEISGYLRGGLPFRFLPLLPAAAFLGAWGWKVASPFAPAVWLACLALEPRFNNAFYGSPRELEALSLLPSKWERIVLLKNLSTAGIAGCVFVLLSVVSLWFSPELQPGRRALDAALYLPTILFPLLILGNEASSRHPRPGAGGFTGDLAEAAWMSITLLVVSLPYVIITDLIERPLLCVPYAALAAGSWFLGSVPRTAARIVHTPIDPWKTTDTSSIS